MNSDITLPLSIPKFLSGWLPMLAVTASVPPPGPRLGQIFFIYIAGIPIPIVTAVLALAGILLARPFAHRAESDLGWPLFAAVTLIMLIVVELWIIETQPTWLFGFVVAIGLGFSGYSMIEMFGTQVKGFLKAVLWPLGLLQQVAEQITELVRALLARRKKKNGDVSGDAPEEGPE